MPDDSRPQIPEFSPLADCQSKLRSRLLPGVCTSVRRLFAETGSDECNAIYHQLILTSYTDVPPRRWGDASFSVRNLQPVLISLAIAATTQDLPPQPKIGAKVCVATVANA